jgi:hypothetical protein
MKTSSKWYTTVTYALILGVLGGGCCGPMACVMTFGAPMMERSQLDPAAGAIFGIGAVACIWGAIALYRKANDERQKDLDQAPKADREESE